MKFDNLGNFMHNSKNYIEKGVTRIFLLKFIMRYESETIKIMEAHAEHDFGPTWLGVVVCASDFKKEYV